MTGSRLIAWMLPLCHLTLTMGYSLPNRLGLCPEIYSLLGFEPSLECDPKTTIPILIDRVHTVEVLRSPLVEFLSLKHIQLDNFISVGDASSDKEHLQGLITLLAFITVRPLKPCFMLKALMGFPSQSILPDLKPLLLSESLCSHASRCQTSFRSVKNGKRKNPGFEALFLKASSTCKQRRLTFTKSLVLSQGSHP